MVEANNVLFDQLERARAAKLRYAMTTIDLRQDAKYYATNMFSSESRESSFGQELRGIDIYMPQRCAKVKELEEGIEAQTGVSAAQSELTEALAQIY